jgi:hypothetical protein
VESHVEARHRRILGTSVAFVAANSSPSW